MKTLDFKNGTEYAYNIVKMLSDNNVSYQIKVTKMEKGAFNSYEGYQFTFNVKITILDDKKVFSDNKGKSKIFAIATNSTYLDEFEHNDLKAEFQEYLEMLYFWNTKEI